MLGWFNKAWQALSRVWRDMPLSDHKVLDWLGTGTMSAAGEEVTAQTAMLISGVYRAVQLYGEVHGTLPLGVYSRSGKRRKYVDSHPTHYVLHQRPNPETTAMTFWCLQEAYRHFHGASYAEIEWNGRGQCIGLWQIEPWRVTPRRNADSKLLEFVVTGGLNGSRTVAAKDMVHIPNFSWCGAHGMSTIGFARESLGRILGAGRFASNAFESGGIPQGMVKHPGKMEKQARDNFRKEWRENAIKNRGGVGILWEGMDWVNMTMKAEDMQFLATLKDGTIDVCRWFNTPPHLLFELERAINNNAETGDLGFAKYGVIPLCLRWEQELNYKLLTDDLYCKHSFEGLLRGDSAARTTFMKAMREMGVFSPNDICEIEDLDDIGPQGDVRVVNSTYIPLHLVDEYWQNKSKPTPGRPGGAPNDMPPGGADPAPDATPADSPPASGGAPQPSKRPVKPLEADPFYRSELARMQRREHKALRKAAKSPREFLAWMETYYQKHAELLREVLYAPVANRLEMDDPDLTAAAVGNLVDVYVAGTKAELLRAAEVPAAKLEASIEAFIDSRSELAAV